MLYLIDLMKGAASGSKVRKYSNEKQERSGIQIDQAYGICWDFD